MSVRACARVCVTCLALITAGIVSQVSKSIYRRQCVGSHVVPNTQQLFTFEFGIRIINTWILELLNDVS